MKKSLLLIAATMFVAQNASAAFIAYSAGNFSNSIPIFADDTGNFSGGPTTPVINLSKFDPALGTLIGVTFDVSPGDVDWTADLGGDPAPGADFMVEFESNLQSDLTYFNGSSSIVLEGVVDNIFLSCDGFDGDPCFDSTGNSSDFDGIGSFIVPRTLGDFNLADIVGIGDVENFNIGTTVFGASFSTLEGMDSIQVFGGADITGAIVTIVYEYTPIPVPAAVWLFGSALGLLGWMRRSAL